RRHRHLVDDAPCVHVYELEAAELAGADVALDEVVGIEQRALGSLTLLVGQAPPEFSHHLPHYRTYVPRSRGQYRRMADGYDVIVIGAGPAGENAADRAAQ